MKLPLILGLVVALSVCACDDTTNHESANSESNNGKFVIINNTKYQCFVYNDINVGNYGNIIDDFYRRKLLTPEAYNSGVKVRISGPDVNNYGSVVIYYIDKDDSCVLWSESISLQEYHQRLGQSPIGLSPFYQEDKTENRRNQK